MSPKFYGTKMATNTGRHVIYNWLRRSEEVKKSVPEAKYYNFEGLQIITTNDKQRKSLLSTIELMEDLCNSRLAAIQKLRKQIYGGNADV